MEFVDVKNIRFPVILSLPCHCSSGQPSGEMSGDEPMTPRRGFSDYHPDDMLASSQIFEPVGEEAGLADPGAYPRRIGVS
jgi:hypothetical protein